MASARALTSGFQMARASCNLHITILESSDSRTQVPGSFPFECCCTKHVQLSNVLEHLDHLCNSCTTPQRGEKNKLSLSAVRTTTWDLGNPNLQPPFPAVSCHKTPPGCEKR